MKITSVAFSGSNPSMGPHNTPSSKSLNMIPYPKEAESLLDDTKVNDSVTLRQYLLLRIEDKQDELTRIHSAFDPGDLEKGERILDLEITLEEFGTITLSDLRTISLTGSGFENFKELHNKEGIVSSFSSDIERDDDATVSPDNDRVRPLKTPSEKD